MTKGDDPSAAPAGTDPALARLAEQITRRLQAGDDVEIEDIARLHPAQVGPIRGILPMLNALTELGRRHIRNQREN